MTGPGMRSAVVLPGGTANQQLEQAVAAEQAGWDGVFVWEAGYGVDAWTLLAAMAARTSRVRLGTMLTPLPWRRPWKVASQVATLDQISGGRAVQRRQPGGDAGPDLRRPGGPRGGHRRHRHRPARHRRGHRHPRPCRTARRGDRPDPRAVGR